MFPLAPLKCFKDERLSNVRIPLDPLCRLLVYMFVLSLSLYKCTIVYLNDSLLEKVLFFYTAIDGHRYLNGR